MSKRPESLRQIESIIASAKDYVVPSEQLRPRVLEEARSRQRHHISSRRMLQVAAVVMLCVVLSIPAQQSLEAWRKSAFSPSADELELQAQEYASQPAVGQNWGMVEAFNKLRQQQKVKVTGGLTGQ